MCTCIDGCTRNLCGGLRRRWKRGGGGGVLFLYAFVILPIYLTSLSGPGTVPPLFWVSDVFDVLILWYIVCTACCCKRVRIGYSAAVFPNMNWTTIFFVSFLFFPLSELSVYYYFVVFFISCCLIVYLVVPGIYCSISSVFHVLLSHCLSRGTWHLLVH